MAHQNVTTSEHIVDEETDTYSLIETIEPGFNTVLAINHRVREIILDYTLMVAVWALMLTFIRDWVSVKWFSALDMLSLGLLNLKMIHAIRKC